MNMSQNAGNVKDVKGFLQLWPCADNSSGKPLTFFNIFNMSRVLGHFEDFRGATSNISRVLAKKGSATFNISYIWAIRSVIESFLDLVLHTFPWL